MTATGTHWKIVNAVVGRDGLKYKLAKTEKETLRLFIMNQDGTNSRSMKFYGKYAKMELERFLRDLGARMLPNGTLAIRESQSIERLTRGLKELGDALSSFEVVQLYLEAPDNVTPNLVRARSLVQSTQMLIHSCEMAIKRARQEEENDND